MIVSKNQQPTEERVGIEFTEVPVVEEHDPEIVKELIDSCYLRRGRSFGAFVLRDVALEDMGIIEEGFSSNTKIATNRTYCNIEFSGAYNPLHIDAGVKRNIGKGTRNNDITLHYTYFGSVEFILLAGSKIFERRKSFLQGIGEQAKKLNLDMFARDTFEPELATMPYRAYRTELKEGDLLIFDHTQPHAFRSPDEPDSRRSMAHFFADQ